MFESDDSGIRPQKSRIDTAFEAQFGKKCLDRKLAGGPQLYGLLSTDYYSRLQKVGIWIWGDLWCLSFFHLWWDQRTGILQLSGFYCKGNGLSFWLLLLWNR